MDKHTLFSSFGKWISPINFQQLQEQVTNLRQDAYTKKLTTEAYIKLFLLAHLQETDSLAAISDGLLDEGLQQEVGFQAISSSQLSRKHRAIDPTLLSTIFVDLVQRIRYFHRQSSARMPLKIIDSSTIPLDLTRYKWAEFRKTKAGVKLHLRLVYMDRHTTYPDKAVLTPAKEHDRGQLEVLVDDKEAMYVFDRGYIDYERFDRMTDDGYFFVSRLRKNAFVRVLESFSLTDDSPVLSDQMVVIGSPQNRTENVFRLLKVDDTKGNQLLLITNRFDISAEEIADIYRDRWAVELFFKWLKQHVKIKAFYGFDETAVHNQIFLALIVYCLHVLIQLETNSKKRILQISRWLKAALWKPSRVWIRRFDNRSVP
ncbi:IS4 family transposase [Salicibibacter halophilus]|uniref:IS4 family transposase n=1 Tax=Salicibibacter halophilus TaxID=2502791 RepID=A0A514LIP6_9BACI|nr:IS4 family transposase [Salicibibacter halophilus]QDI91395.1 IS4 family transposase [Salicibibacter halophilus]